MSVQTTASQVHYAGNGSIVTPYPIPFGFLLASDIEVIVTDPNGVDATLSPGTYTITGAGEDSGGSLTTVVAYPNTWRITITRDPPITQLVGYQPQDAFPAETHEGCLDKLTHIAQRLSERFDHTITFPDSIDLPPIGPPEPNTVLAFNGSDPASVTYYDSAELLAFLELPGTTVLNKPTAHWPDATSRPAKVPDFEGQLGVQMDDNSLWVSTGVTAGAWEPTTGIQETRVVTTSAQLDEAVALGGMIYVVGTIQRTTPVTLTVPGTHLVGIGEGAGIELNSAAVSTVVIAGAAGQVICGLEISSTMVLENLMGGTTANGSAVITGISSTAGLGVGHIVTAATIPVIATIVSVDSASQITISTTANANATLTLTVHNTHQGIALDTTSGIGTRVCHCRIFNIGSGIRSERGESAPRNPNVKLHDNYIHSFTNAGIYMSWNFDGIQIVGNRIETRVDAETHRVFHNCIWVGTACTAINVSRNVCDGADARWGIEVFYCPGTVVSNNQVIGCLCGISMGGTDDSVCVGNSVTGFSTTGGAGMIELVGQNIICSANVIDGGDNQCGIAVNADNATSVPTKVTVASNTIRRCWYGIQVYTGVGKMIGVEDSLFVGNTVYAHSRSGNLGRPIYFNADLGLGRFHRRNTVANNTIIGQAGGAIYLLGAYETLVANNVQIAAWLSDELYPALGAAAGGSDLKNNLVYLTAGSFRAGPGLPLQSAGADALTFPGTNRRIDPGTLYAIDTTASSATVTLDTPASSASVKVGMKVEGATTYQTGTLTNASAVVTGLSSTASLLAGMAVSGTGVPGGATIASVNSATSISLSVPAAIDPSSPTVTLAFGPIGIPAGATITAITGTTAACTGFTMSAPATVTGTVPVKLYWEPPSAERFRQPGGGTFHNPGVDEDVAAINWVMDLGTLRQARRSEFGTNNAYTLNIVGAVDGMRGTWILKNVIGGVVTVVLPAGSKITGGSPVTLTAAAGSIDVLKFDYDGEIFYWQKVMTLV